MTLRNVLFASLATSASAVQLLTSAFGSDTVNGSVTTFDLSGLGGAAKLTAINKFYQAGAQPTWLDLSLGNRKVIYIDEAWSGDASVGTIKLDKDGKATRLNVLIPIVGSPVAIQAYNGEKAISIAHYNTGSITTYAVGADGFTKLEVFKYSNATHGPKPQQADGSHVHHTVLDPSGQYLVFPDLGLDAVHVYCIDPKTNKLTAHDDIKTKPGYGPRHAAFWKSGKDTFLFVIHELESRITSYKVKYSTSGIAFEEVDDVSTFGDKPGNTTGSAAAEIIISPDNKFVLGSNRLSPRFTVPNPDPTNSTQIPSDSIVTFQPQPNGKLKYTQLHESGGLNPRHFSLNKDGTIISIANGGSFKPSLDLYERDPKTGLIGKKIVSTIDVGGGINNVRWLE